jgi:predicted kinase
MEYLFPLLESRGVIIIDDYGFWKGSRKAVDEYLSEHGIALLLHRMDATGRSAVKL